MRMRDIILGTVIIGLLVVIVGWVAVSVYEHENTSGQAAPTAAYASVS